MAQAIIFFLVLSIAIGLATQAVRKMNNQTRWNLTKLMFFSTMCALAAIVVMLSIVVLF